MAYEEGSSGRDRNAAQVKAHTHPTISSLGCHDGGRVVVESIAHHLREALCLSESSDRRLSIDALRQHSLKRGAADGVEALKVHGGTTVEELGAVVEVGNRQHDQDHEWHHTHHHTKPRKKPTNGYEGEAGLLWEGKVQILRVESEARQRASHRCGVKI